MNLRNASRWRLACLGLVCCCSFEVFLCAAPNQTQQFRSLTIHRSGGFAGVEEEWFFSEKGIRSTTDRAPISVPLDKLDRLRRLVAVAIRKGEGHPPVSVCCDCFTYKITLWYDDGLQVLVIPEITGKAGAGTMELLGLIRELISDPKPKP